MRYQWKKEWTAPAMVGAVSFAAGAAAGAFGYKLKIEREIRDIEDAMTELASVKVDVPVVKKMTRNMVDADQGKPVPPAPETLPPRPRFQELEIEDEPEPEVFLDKIQNLKIGDEETVLYQGVPIVKNVFDPDWDQAAEEAERTTDAPYILHQDEFFANEKGYHQTSCEWYEGDKILVDDRDVPIYAPEKVVGVLRFGRGTNDPNTVYVRNDQNKAEYEITRNPGSYQFEVLGLVAEAEGEADELRHSQQIRRFRPE